MAGTDITLKGADGEFGAYLASPAGHKGPGIVVIQEIFGVNTVMRHICDGLAAQGYFALAPDLFWRIEPNVQLTDQNEQGWKRAFEFYQKFNADTGVHDIQTAITHLRGFSGVGPKVGTVGYCLGGFLAYLASTRTNTDASVSFYGVAIETKLGEKDKIKKPILLHIAEKDQFVPSSAQRQIAEALADSPLATVHIYEGQDHAFAREGGQHYDKASADLANKRTADFFQHHLQ